MNRGITENSPKKVRDALFHVMTAGIAARGAGFTLKDAIGMLEYGFRNGTVVIEKKRKRK